jgi:hypothetical protein
MDYTTMAAISFSRVGFLSNYFALVSATIAEVLD